MPTLTLLTPPAAEPLTLAEAKSWLRVEIADDDALISGLISAARALAEKETGRSFLTQQWRLTAADWGDRRAWSLADWQSSPRSITLPRAPLQSVESIRYRPSASADLVTLSTSIYRVIPGDPGKVVPISGAFPPVDGSDGSIEVEFTAGFADAIAGVEPGTAEPIRLAIRYALGTWYENRESTIVGTTATELPNGSKLILSALKTGVYW